MSEDTVAYRVKPPADWHPTEAPVKTYEGEEPPGFTFGRRYRNPYYRAIRPIHRWADGERQELLISELADVTDVLHAFDCNDHDLGEIVAKVLRLDRKPGTDKVQECIKLMEHAQAYLDRLYAARRKRDESA